GCSRESIGSGERGNGQGIGRDQGGCDQGCRRLEGGGSESRRRSDEGDGSGQTSGQGRQEVGRFRPSIKRIWKICVRCTCWAFAGTDPSHTHLSALSTRVDGASFIASLTYHVQRFDRYGGNKGGQQHTAEPD